MTVQASNNQPVINPAAQLDVSVGRANSADRAALESSSQAAVRLHFGDMLPATTSTELRPSAEYTAGVVAVVDAPIKNDAGNFVLEQLAARGLGNSPVVPGIREQYAAAPGALNLAA